MTAHLPGGARDYDALDAEEQAVVRSYWKERWPSWSPPCGSTGSGRLSEGRTRSWTSAVGWCGANPRPNRNRGATRAADSSLGERVRWGG